MSLLDVDALSSTDSTFAAGALESTVTEIPAFNFSSANVVHVDLDGELRFHNILYKLVVPFSLQSLITPKWRY